MAGVREIPRHGRRSATGKIARVVQHAWNRMVACRQPRIQVGAMKVILTTSKAGMMYRVGECHDYCRWVGGSGSGGDPKEKLTHEASFWSCWLAGT